MNMSPSIQRLHMASVYLQGKYNPPDFLDTRVDVYAYLVVTGSDVVLIDTGVGEGNAHIEGVFAPRRTSIVKELARYGIDTTGVKLLVNSHLHFDHCGNNHLFPNAEIFVQKTELKVARTTIHTVREWFDYEDARIVPVDGDMEISPGVKLLSTPGHTPGHQSILVEIADNRILIAAQAAYTADEYERGGDPEFQAHEGFEEQYLQSIQRLKSLEADIAYFSHDTATVRAS